MTASPEPAPPQGPAASLRSLGENLVALLHTRIELATVELREEGERRKEMAVLAAVAAVFLAMGALLFALFVVILFWDTHRILAAGGMTALYAGIGLFAVIRLKQSVRESPPPFEATLAEFAKDVEALKGARE